METKHTPIPYYLGINPLMVKNRDGLRIAKIPTLHEHGEREADDYNIEMANAEFIVRACNNHDALVGALEFCTGIIEAYAFHAVKPKIQFNESGLAEFRKAQELLSRAKGE
jgi:hypothetical protein